MEKKTSSSKVWPAGGDIEPEPRWVINAPRLKPHITAWSAVYSHGTSDPILLNRIFAEIALKQTFQKWQPVKPPDSLSQVLPLRTKVTKVPSDQVHDAPAALSTALVYLILIWQTDIRSWRCQTLSLKAMHSWRPKCCWWIISPKKKKLISMIFWIRKKK